MSEEARLAEVICIAIKEVPFKLVTLGQLQTGLNAAIDYDLNSYRAYFQRRINEKKEEIHLFEFSTLVSKRYKKGTKINYKDDAVVIVRWIINKGLFVIKGPKVGTKILSIKDIQFNEFIRYADFVANKETLKV